MYNVYTYDYNRFSSSNHPTLISLMAAPLQNCCNLIKFYFKIEQISKMFVKSLLFSWVRIEGKVGLRCHYRPRSSFFRFSGKRLAESGCFSA